MIKQINIGITIGFTLFSFVSHQLLAQQPTQPAKVEKIEVTGSNIKRVDTETAAPILVITREEIERSAQSTVADILHSLPTNTGFSFDELLPIVSRPARRASLW